jgi:hypothetical protein
MKSRMIFRVLAGITVFALLWSFTATFARADDPAPTDPPPAEQVSPEVVGEPAAESPAEPEAVPDEPAETTQEENVSLPGISLLDPYITDALEPTDENTAPEIIEVSTEVVTEPPPTLLQEAQSLFVLVLSALDGFVGPSDVDLLLDDENGNGLHGDDCSQNPDICTKWEAVELPDPVDGITTIPFEGTQLVIHAGGGTSESKFEEGSGVSCNDADGGDDFCVRWNGDGTVSIWANDCAEFVGRNNNCQEAPAYSYVLDIGEETENPCPGGDFNGDAEGCGENPCPNGDLNGDLPGCDPVDPCPGGDFNGDAEGCGENPCPNGDNNGTAPGCDDPVDPCPDGDFNGDAEGCGENPCPNGDNNGTAPGCDDPVPCPNGDLNGDLPGCDPVLNPPGGTGGGPVNSCGMFYGNDTKTPAFIAWFLKGWCNWMELGDGPGGRPGENPIRRLYNR